MRKCRTVALTWRSTESFAASLKADLETEPEYFHGMHHVGPLMTIGGGVPVDVGGALARDRGRFGCLDRRRRRARGAGRRNHFEPLTALDIIIIS